MSAARQIQQTADHPAFVGTIDQQRAYRRELIKAQAKALRAAGLHDIADRHEANELPRVDIVSHCPACRLELIADDECPRCVADDFIAGEV